jgi:hypothetical protein
MRRKEETMTKIAYDPRIVDSYNQYLGKKRGQMRRQSAMGQMELRAMERALALGHVPGIGLDGKYESFLFCETFRCFAFCSISRDEGVHGPIVEVPCGEQTIIQPDPESTWEQGNSEWYTVVVQRRPMPY